MPKTTHVKAHHRGFFGKEYPQEHWNEHHPRSVKADKERKAMKPGYRKAKRSGKTYFEARENRSDKNPKKRF